MTGDLGPLLRAIDADAYRKTHGPSKRAVARAIERDIGLRSDLSALRLVRGRCRAKRCRSRLGVVRVTIDTTSAARIESRAWLECAVCRRPWRTVPTPDLSTMPYQRVRLTLILPHEERTWYARGAWHRTDDGQGELREATYRDVMAASEDWRKRNRQLTDARERAKARNAAADAEASAQLMAVLAARDARRPPHGPEDPTLTYDLPADRAARLCSACGHPADRHEGREAYCPTAA